MLTQKEIDMTMFQTRTKYSDIESCINKDNIKDLSIKDKYIIVYDISYPISILKRMTSIETDMDLDNETVLRISYGLLNSVAHFRHFFSTKMKCSSVIIMYSSDESVYKEFGKITDTLRKILNLFVKTIFIEKLDEESKFIYNHICYFACLNITLSNSAASRKCRIVYVGNNQLAMQMLRIDRDMIFIKHNHISNGTKIFFDFIYDLENEIERITYHNTDLIGFVLSIFGFKHGFPRLESLKRKKIINIYKQIIENCKDVDIVDKDNYNDLIKNIQLSESDKQLIGLRLKAIDIDFQNKLYSLTKSLMNIWSSKIHTKSLYSINDFTQFNDIELQSNWLNGN